MKKWILILAILAIVVPITTYASPFLCSDPSTDVISQVEVEINGTVYSGTYTVSGADVRLYDLSGLANGNYVFRARWAGTTGWWSDWSDPMSAVKSGKPANFRIK